MRVRTVVVLVAVLAALGGGAGVALTWSDGDGSLSAVWVSDTPRNTTVNHHGVGAGGDVVVAPASEPGAGPEDSRYTCALVRLEPSDGAVRWRWAVPRDLCFLHALTKPAVGDLDGDGRQEVVAGTTEREVVVLDSERGEETFHVPMSQYSYGQPTVTDLTGDGTPEVVASDISGNLTVVAANGTVLWRGNVSRSVWASPVVADVDADDQPEVVVGSSAEVVVFERDGAVAWRRAVPGRDVAVSRVEGDPTVVAAGTGDPDVRALDGATGERRWGATLSGSRLRTVADGDGDATPEVYVSAPGGVVAALDATDGSEEWRTRLETADDLTTPAPVLADLDGEGAPELAVASEAGTVSVLDPADGAELAAYERDVPVWTSVTTANLTDSPGREILVRYGDGRVVALAYSA
jgi:outer membrane protein assembly factor BamB